MLASKTLVECWSWLMRQLAVHGYEGKASPFHWWNPDVPFHSWPNIVASLRLTCPSRLMSISSLGIKEPFYFVADAYYAKAAILTKFLRNRIDLERTEGIRLVA